MTASNPNPNPALSPVELAAHLQQRLPGWALRENRLFKEYRFHDFTQAFAFMTQVALWAEKHDHHPEWSNVYNRVTLELLTHDAAPEGAITLKDVELAAFAESASVFPRR